jgi:hypothetical protein
LIHQDWGWSGGEFTLSEVDLIYPCHCKGGNQHAKIGKKVV